jgi:hypothetical protein
MRGTVNQYLTQPCLYPQLAMVPVIASRRLLPGLRAIYARGEQYM